MPFVLRKATAATSGPSRRWFRLSITMEVEARNRIAEQYKMPLLLRLHEVYRGKVVEDGESVFGSFPSWPEDGKSI